MGTLVEPPLGGVFWGKKRTRRPRCRSWYSRSVEAFVPAVGPAHAVDRRQEQTQLAAQCVPERWLHSLLSHVLFGDSCFSMHVRHSQRVESEERERRVRESEERE